MPTLDYYNENAASLVKKYESAKVQKLQELLLSCFRPGSRLLELGCGSGRDASFMAEKGFRVTAVDGSDQMIKAARIQHPSLKESLHTVMVPKGLSKMGEFDGIYSIAFLMHLSRKDIETTLKKANQMIRNKGKLFFSVPFKRQDVNAGEFDEKGRLFTTMTDSQWFDLSEKAGFEIEDFQVTEDGLGRKGTAWLNCLAIKKYA